ncbi:glycoside hydrolase family 88 protein [Opitutus terrae]|uniref:Glycosyl hydrolase, family 88 n=1 Tax=Opitutus terrae (strain DSM 11246 / JCM 15787 / PB90-1) TaxID=452637 RepID=B1ZXB2_OPITP|nr:glycoside hydrolase family 88 protein [Opitutus terrae]ACB76164.1 glycosyl hydrolase, family 88 [Opitutus terrae PB90-1]
MIRSDLSLSPSALDRDLDRLFALSATKIELLQRSWDPRQGTPVFTVEGRYTSRGWTEWTQGFQFGSALLQFAATGDQHMLAFGRNATREHMATHVSHIGVHDHGFNNVSTYGTLYHLARAGRFDCSEGELQFYQLALKLSGAVQAARWTDLPEGQGYIYSFNGPHSLFADTIRSLRVLALSHAFGHCLMGERDRRLSLLQRLVQHADTTARYNVYFGQGRDAYDVRGRVAHESVFNLNDGSYRCPSSQQGYSPFTTWTRGLAWIICGYAEQLAFLDTRSEADLAPFGGKPAVLERFLATATACADFYLEHTPTDGVPYWDTGAPGLHRLGDYLNRPADPFNEYEPVDSSAAAIAGQGLVRLALFLQGRQQSEAAARYLAAGLTVARTLLNEPYLSTAPGHQGLLLHTVYHRPAGWDHVPAGRRVPCGESCQWGDYHLLELALLLRTLAESRSPYTFFGL